MCVDLCVGHCATDSLIQLPLNKYLILSRRALFTELTEAQKLNYNIIGWDHELY